MARRGSTQRPGRGRLDPRQAYMRHREAVYSGSDDIFAVNPMRRSFFISAGSWLTIVFPALFFEGNLQALVLIGFGWIAAAGVIFVTPIFFWCLAEEAWDSWRRKRHPMIDELDLSPRAYNLLRRHGFEMIESLESVPDSTLLLLSNMDPRTVHEIRRAVNLWRYRRWQEQGFPADSAP